MFWKRQIPIAIVAIVGIFTLFGWFFDHPAIASFVNDDATQWYDILASFAIFLGALNLLKLQFQKIRKRKRNWQYSILAISGFAFAFIAGFVMLGAYFVEVKDPGTDPANVAQVAAAEFNQDAQGFENALNLATDDAPLRIEKVYYTKKEAEKLSEQLRAAGATVETNSAEWGSHLLTQDSLFNWMFWKMFTPLQATMFALLAFLVASASYRAFRIRNFEATLLLVSGIILMLGRVPIGSKISSWFILYLLVLLSGIGVNTLLKNRLATVATVVLGLVIVTIAGMLAGWPVDKPAMFFLPTLQDWIYFYPNVAGARAIMIGIGLGVFATSIKYILGIEKSYIGE
jgi:hypothetical protein